MDFMMYPRENLKEVFPETWSSKLNGIYFLFGEDGEMIYIGKGKTIYRRLYAHFNSHFDNIWEYEKMFYYFSFLVLEDYSTSTEIEKKYIQKYQPKLNATYSGDFRKNALQEKKDAHLNSYARSKGFKDMDEYMDDAFDKWEGL